MSWSQSGSGLGAGEWFLHRGHREAAKSSSEFIKVSFVWKLLRGLAPVNARAFAYLSPVSGRLALFAHESALLMSALQAFKKKLHLISKAFIDFCHWIFRCCLSKSCSMTKDFICLVSFFCSEFGGFCCLCIFNLLNFVYTLEKKSSHQGRGKGFCVWVFLVLRVFVLCVFSLCGWVQTRIERFYSKIQDFLFVLAGMFSFCWCSLCSVCFGKASTVYCEEEQGCASSTAVPPEGKRDGGKGALEKRRHNRKFWVNTE